MFEHHSFSWFTFVFMKVTASILLVFFSLLTIQPLLTIAQGSRAQKTESCVLPCCNHPKEKKSTKAPMKGSCGEMSCNPFGEYACCTGFIVSNKTLFTFIPEKVWEKKILFTQTYVSNFVGDCWRPPESILFIS
jgi:hypothetical protein